MAGATHMLKNTGGLKSCLMKIQAPVGMKTREYDRDQVQDEYSPWKGYNGGYLVMKL